MTTLRSFLLVGLLTCCAGCDRQSEATSSAQPEVPTVPDHQGKPIVPSWAEQSAKPRIAKEKALEIAVALAKEKKIKLELFDAPKISFSVLRQEWDIFYSMKPPVVPGGHFTIVVEEAGGTRFVAGK